jgi:predicted transcriptional regulator
MAHVSACLRLYELSGDPRDFPPYIDLNRLLRRGETTRLCLEALAKEGPLSTRELAQRVMRARPPWSA